MRSRAAREVLVVAATKDFCRDDAVSGGAFGYSCADTLEEARSALGSRFFDLALVDLPFDGPGGRPELAALRAADPDVALLLVTDLSVNAAKLVELFNDGLIAGSVDRQLSRERLEARFEAVLGRPTAPGGDAELGQAQGFVDTLFSSLPGILNIYAEDGSLFRWNREFEELTGYSAEELRSIRPDEIMTIVGEPSVVALVAKTLERRRVAGEYSILTKGGARLPFAFTSVASSYLGREAAIILGLGISRLKETEARLREENAFSDSLIQNLPGLFVIRDFNLRLLKWNKNLETMSGYTEDELRALDGRALAESPSGENAEALRLAVLRGEDRSLEIVFRTKTGTRVPHFVRILKIDYRGVPAIMNIGFDISEQRRNAPPSRELSGRRLLLAEDNEINQMVAREQLQSFGASVDIARDGKEALRMLSAARYDAVLMDLHMPVLDGFAATRIIKSDPRLKDVIVIAMTADDLPRDSVEYRDSGLDDAVQKPIDERQLFETLRRWLGAARPPPDPEPLPSITGLDSARGLERVLMSREIYRRILSRYHAVDGREAPLRILEAIDAGDLALAAKLTHRLKGVSGNIGATSLYDRLVELERRLHAGRIEAARKSALDAIEDNGALVGAIGEWKARTDSGERP